MALDVNNTEDQQDHPIFARIESGDLDGVKNYLEVEGVSVEIEDKHGMTPLMHAAWKGRLDMTQYFLQQGSDPNGGNHDHGYTALHFSALANKPELCTTLLDAGAKVYHTNSVNRTAAQMAAFVGNHGCVAVINNFVPKEDVYYYTKKQPLEDEPKLPQKLAKPLHKLIMSMNSHPVKIAYHFRDSPVLLDNISKARKVLEMMSEKEFKDRKDVNEVLSLKYHILHYIVKDIEKQQEKDLSRPGDKKTPFLDRWIKSMLTGRESDGYPVFQENFLRQSIREFPFPESQLFKALVANFSESQVYGAGGVNAAEFINASFNGQKGFRDGVNCDTCGEPGAEKKCSGCQEAQYCDQACQRFHWFVHKKHCSKLKMKNDSVKKTDGDK